MTEPYLKRLLADHETILLITRRHGFVFFRSILFELIFAAAIIAVVSIVWSLGLFVLPIYLGYLLLIIPLASLYRDYLIWKNHEYIITNRRVMQISGVFNKNVIDSSLEKVNDVKMSQPFWGRVFNFGDIEILTASELGVNLFKTIGDPVRFKTTMLNANEGMGLDHDQYLSHSAAGGSQDIPGLIAELDQLREKGVLSDDEFQRKKNELLAKM
jgi:hypothetical protein